MVRDSIRVVPESENIDRDSYEPAYAQLANILRRQIAEGHYIPGDQLPSEAQLCQRFNVSPMTVRRAVNLLVDQRVVTTEQGRGTFVRPLELSTATFDLNELHELFVNDSKTQVKLLEVRVVSSDDETAGRLAQEPGTPAIYIRRLITLDKEPVFYHRAYLVYDPKRPIVEAEMDTTSLQGLFAGTDNMLLKRGELTVKTILVNEEEAQILQTPLPAAAFCLEHTFYDFEDKPVSFGWFICRGDRLVFRTRVGID